MLVCASYTYIGVSHESVYVWVYVWLWSHCGLPLGLFQVEFTVLVYQQFLFSQQEEVPGFLTVGGRTLFIVTEKTRAKEKKWDGVVRVVNLRTLLSFFSKKNSSKPASSFLAEFFFFKKFRQASILFHDGDKRSIFSSGSSWYGGMRMDLDYGEPLWHACKIASDRIALVARYLRGNSVGGDFATLY